MRSRGVCLPTFDSETLSENVRKALSRCLVTNSSIILFEQAFDLIRILKDYDRNQVSTSAVPVQKNDKNNLSRFLDFCSEMEGHLPRLNLIWLVELHLERYSPGNHLFGGCPALYDFGENMELLRRLAPSLFESTANSCQIIEDVRAIVKTREVDLMGELGLDHPLFLRVRELQKCLRFFEELYKFADLYITSQHASYLLPDGGAQLVMESIIAWYKIVLSLSCAYDRHCKRCDKCSVVSEIQGGPEIDKIVAHEDFEGLPGVIQVALKHVQELCKCLLSFKRALDSPISTISLKINKVLEVASDLERVLKGGFQSSLSEWWVGCIEPGVGDLRRYFKAMKKALDDMDEAFRQLDSESLRDRGMEILWSITLEEIHDRQEPILHLFSQFSSSKKDGGKIAADESFDEEILRKVRKSLARQPDQSRGNEKDSLSLGDEEKHYCLKKLYDHFCDKYMGIPYDLKKKLFCETVRTLQDRLSVACSASLLDAYLPRRFFRFGWFSYYSVMPLILLTLAILFSGWGLFLGLFSLCMVIIFAGFLLVPETGVEKYFSDKENTMALIFGQWLPGFVVPMVLSLSPFVLSDELKAFVYTQIKGPILFLLWIAVFLLFSLFAIWKLQSPLQSGKCKNTVRILGILWPQALFFSFFMPIILQNPLNGSKETCITFFRLGSGVIKIPRVISINAWKVSFFAYPAPSLIFSVLCLFVAVFLEGFYRKR